MTKSLRLLNQIIAGGRETVSPAWVMAETGVSRQAAVNMLTRLCRQGLLDRVGHGHYALRQLGVLGTAAAAEDQGLAVGALFDGRPHRIAYRSALDQWDLLTRPWETVQVASPLRLGHRTVSGRPLQLIKESSETVGIGAVQVRGGAWVSDIERALIDCAARPRLAGGIDPLAQGLASADRLDIGRLRSHLEKLHAGPAARRIGSISAALGLENIASAMDPFAPTGFDYIDLDPAEHRSATETSSGSLDRKWRVRWHLLPEELANNVWR